MTKVLVGEKELEIVIGEKTIDKARQLNVTENEIKVIIENNPETVEDIKENEEILLVSNLTISFYVTGDNLVVTNVFGEQNIY